MSRTETNADTTHAQNVVKGLKDVGSDAKYVATEAKGAAVDALGQAKEVAAEKYGQIRDQAGEHYAKVREQAGAYYEQGKQKVADYEGQVENYIREQPIKALLIAAGVGLVAGFLIKRR